MEQQKIISSNNMLAEVKPSVWISVDEKPKLATYHLTYSKQGITTISVWNHKYWKSLTNEIIDDITHWMPIPEPPSVGFSSEGQLNILNK